MQMEGKMRNMRAVAGILLAALLPCRAAAAGAAAENTAAACSDRIDNDGNGLVDCADPGCGRLIFCARNAAAPAPEEAPPTFKKISGGLGIYGSLGILNSITQTHDGLTHRVHAEPVTGGTGIFGEITPLSYLAIGLELDIALPNVKVSVGNHHDEAHYVLVSGLIRIRFPLKLHPAVAAYPLLAAGIGILVIDGTNEKAYASSAFHVSWGIGFEFTYRRRLKPFVEARYWYTSAFDDITNLDLQRTVIHLLAINVGMRFF